MSIKQAIEAQRVLFEADAELMGFDLTRCENIGVEPWADYANSDTGHRWGGWLGAALRSMPAEPYAYAVYFPDQPTEELVHDLDELCEDMTNREHTITPLFATPPTAPVPLSDAEIAEACKGVLCVHPNAQTTRDIARAIERAVLGRGEKA